MQTLAGNHFGHKTFTSFKLSPLVSRRNQTISLLCNWIQECCVPGHLQHLCHWALTRQWKWTWGNWGTWLALIPNLVKLQLMLELNLSPRFWAAFGLTIFSSLRHIWPAGFQANWEWNKHWNLAAGKPVYFYLKVLKTVSGRKCGLIVNIVNDP